MLEKWQEAGADGDPNELRKLFLKQSLVPISATMVQVCICTYDNQGDTHHDFSRRVVLVVVLVVLICCCFVCTLASNMPQPFRFFPDLLAILQQQDAHINAAQY